MNVISFFILLTSMNIIYVALAQNSANDKFLGGKYDNILDKYLSVKYKYWGDGVKGKNVKIAILDSGIAASYKNYTKCDIKDVVNFTDERDEDVNGHGTFISSLICDKDLGISPEAEIYVYKVFSKERRTTFQWMLRGLEKAIESEVDIINLSLGRINFDDKVLIDKIDEATKKGIIIITSAGNDGPAFGSINFPGNLPNVLTVGATGKDIFSVLEVSSRGPAILGKNLLISKPNTWAPGEHIQGLDILGNLTIKNGTSVSSALVTGYLSLLLSQNYQERKFFNIGSILLLIKESNLNFPEINKNEIISGVFNLEGLFEITNFYLMNKNKLQIQILNNIVDFSLTYHTNFTISAENKIYQSISLYSSMQPLYFSLIFISPNTNEINKVNYKTTLDDNLNSDLESCVRLEPVIQGKNQNYFYFSNHVGVLQMKLTIDNDLKCRFFKEKVDWNVFFKDEIRDEMVGFKLIFNIIPTPSRYSRILIDRYLNLVYPFDGNIPRDNLIDNWYNFDWTFESIDTNYYGMAKYLISEDFYLEELNEPLDCVDFANYSILMIIDNEKALTSSEIKRLRYEYEENHLSLFIISEWNEPNVKSEFKLDNPGGGEITSLNSLLEPYGIEIGMDSISRDFKINNRMLKIRSASSISKFPSKSYLFGNYLKNDISIINPKETLKLYRAILGFVDQLEGKSNSGRLAIFTDTYCMDDYQLGHNFRSENCFWMISSIIKFLIHGNFVHNELQLKFKTPLLYDYYDYPNRSKNFTLNTVNSGNETHRNISQKDNQDSPHIKETCCYKNYTLALNENNLFDYTNYLHKSTLTKTSTIPNLITKYSFDNEKADEEKIENKVLELVEDILYVLVPICSIILFVILIIQCKKIKMKRSRRYMPANLSQLKTTSIRIANLNESSETSSIIINSLV